MNRPPRLARTGISVLALLYWTPLLWGQATTKPAILIVRTTPDAELEVDGVKTTKTGESRRFESPPVKVDWQYTYTLRATWKEWGQEVEAVRRVVFSGGDKVEVDLRTPDQPPRKGLTLAGPFSVELEPGQTKRLTFRILRERFEPPAKLRFSGELSSLKFSGATIPAGQESAQVEVTAEASAPPGDRHVSLSVEVGPLAEGRFRVTVRKLPAPASLADRYLREGKYAEGETALSERLKGFPRDDQARFGLGTLQFVRALEHQAQSLYRYGLYSDHNQHLPIPFMRLPVTDNPRPEACTYPAVRRIFQELIADLRKVEATLADITDERVKFPLHLASIRLDICGDGASNDRFGTILSLYLRGRAQVLQDEEMLVVFDRGDVAWLRGYCHLLMALAEIFLAHDGQEFFDRVGSLFFANAKTPRPLLRIVPEIPGGAWALGDVDLLDVLALVHLARFPMKEPGRMKAALDHLEKVVALSKESWKFILAETDDDHEWIPNPRQTGVLGIPVQEPIIAGWLESMEEVGDILAGKRLIPFWRGKEERGINLRRVFTEPRDLDLILWIQGTAATPYLEKGPLTKPEVWQRLLTLFGGDLFGFAIWFN
jgi:uncharacterized protein (TIGR03000 family)